ncbi:MAG TPA: 4Fe-4S binding protein [Armatimonadota bacterium]|nr:4Fe-4S binding protein [Armatimonadota bacterium]
MPLFGYSPEGMPKGVPVAPDKPAPNVIVDLEFAAQAAGLGEVGLGGFFLTPEFGTRQRLAMVLTDAELEPDPVADRRLCGDCRACVDACPLGAINADDARPVGVPGHTMWVAAIDWRLCRACPNGAMVGPGRGERPDRIAAACGRACLNQLERADKCANRFEQPFRKRTPWVLDSLHRPVPPGERGYNPASAGCAKASEVGKEGG